MAAPRPDRTAKRRLAQMEAKRRLRADQILRRRRDNIAGAAVLAAVVVGAVVLQLTVFAGNPTADQMQAVNDGLASPSASPGNIGDIPDPATAAEKVFAGNLVTDRGSIGVELEGTVAPQAVAVFNSLAGQGFYTGKNCHRLTTAATMKVLQCGSVDGLGGGDPTFQWGPVENAPADGRYPAGTIAVARGNSDYSNGTQFFIVYQDSIIDPATGGYTIMGKVTSGMDILAAVAAGGVAGNGQDGQPNIPVEITSFVLK